MSERFYSVLSSVMRAARKRSGLTVHQLSGATGYTPGILMSFELGELRPRFTDLAVYARGIGETDVAILRRAWAWESIARR